MVTGALKIAFDLSARSLCFWQNRLHYELHQHGFSAAVDERNQRIQRFFALCITQIIQLVGDHPVSVIVIEIDNANLTDLRHDVPPSVQLPSPESLRSCPCAENTASDREASASAAFRSVRPR